MKKTVSKEIEVCDHCGINEIDMNYQKTCSFCGKLLCWTCNCSVDLIRCCPTCRDSIFKKYRDIQDEMTELENQYSVKEDELKREFNKIKEMVIND